MQKLKLYKQTSDKKQYIVILFIIILLGLVEFVGWTQPVMAQVEQALNPLQAFEVQVVRVVRWPLNSLFVGYQSAEELRELQVKYAYQLAQLNELEQLRQENQMLRQLLENTDRSLEDRKVVTPVVSLSYPAVAGGDQDNIIKGEMVTFQNILLGVVVDVSAHQSRVALLSKKDSVPVLAETEQGVQGIVTGDDRHVLLTEVPHNATLQEGERVVTVGQEGIKRDVLIGTIQRLDTRPSAPTQTAIIEQQVSFYDAPVVEVW